MPQRPHRLGEAVQMNVRVPLALRERHARRVVEIYAEQRKGP